MATGARRVGSGRGKSARSRSHGPRARPHQRGRQRAPRLLATLWLAIGDHEQAEKHALAAYRWAWADGEPYVQRYELTRTTELLQQLNVPIPNLPPYDPAKDEKLPWEDAVAAAIEKLKAEKEKRKGQAGVSPKKG